MSTFGDWWVKTRNAVEAEVETLALAVEPEAKSALVSAVKAGVASALAQHASVPSSTPGDLWVSARDAAVQILKAQGASIGQALVEAAVTEELGGQEVVPTPAPAPSP